MHPNNLKMKSDGFTQDKLRSQMTDICKISDHDKRELIESVQICIKLLGMNQKFKHKTSSIKTKPLTAYQLLN